MPTPCFLVVPTGRVERRLRRYSSTAFDHPTCPWYHDAGTPIDTVTRGLEGTRLDFEDGDERWPTHCERCGYEFKPDDARQLFVDELYARADGLPGEWSLRKAPPGATYYAVWMEGTDFSGQWKGPDGRALMVVLPNKDRTTWHVDGRANNCDSPCKNCGQPYLAHRGGPGGCKSYEDARPHKCWVRHGAPPLITVDKAGVTCGAGAGSILAGDYHGFLQNGVLT